MGTIGNKYLQLTDSDELSQKLLGIYAFEKENHQIIEGVNHRFAGMNELLFKEKTIQIKEEMRGFYKILEERLGMRNVDIPMTLMKTAELNPCILDTDFNTNDRTELIGHILMMFRAGVQLYGDVITMIKDKDIILTHELLPIFTFYVDMESEIENFIKG